MKITGFLAELTEKQIGRKYFSDLEIGTKFIIIEELNLPGYDLLGYFINVKPQELSEGRLYFTGYIERDSWKIIGEIKDNISILRSKL